MNWDQNLKNLGRYKPTVHKIRIVHKYGTSYTYYTPIFNWYMYYGMNKFIEMILSKNSLWIFSFKLCTQQTSAVLKRYKKTRWPKRIQWRMFTPVREGTWRGFRLRGTAGQQTNNTMFQSLNWQSRELLT